MLLIDVEHRREVRREERSLSRSDLPARAGEFLKLEANVLICGAISALLEAMLASSGVRVIGFLCGPVDEVVAAFLNGEVAKPEFCMPGCGGGGGQGRGAGGSGRGRMGGACVCPKCGEKVAHTVGRPCNRIVCPKCGANMTRA